MSEDKFRLLEERLTRIEAALTQRPAPGAGGFTPPGGVVVDPAPWGGGGGSWGTYPPRPVVDPAPWPYWRPRPWPHPIVDSAPWPTPVVDPAPWPSPVVDPAPWHGQFTQSSLAAALGRIGPIGDPAPIDLGKFSLSQLEGTLHSIAAERARLDSMEAMVKRQLERAKQNQDQG